MGFLWRNSGCVPSGLGITGFWETDRSWPWLKLGNISSVERIIAVIN